MSAAGHAKKEEKSGEIARKNDRRRLLVFCRGITYYSSPMSISGALVLVLFCAIFTILCIVSVTKTNIRIDT